MSEKSLLNYSSVEVPDRILDPGLCLTLRPMRYPVFYDMYRDGIDISTIQWAAH